MMLPERRAEPGVLSKFRAHACPKAPVGERSVERRLAPHRSGRPKGRGEVRIGLVVPPGEPELT